MATRTQVFLAADELRGRRERVSLRSVIPILRKRWRGGSYREVGPLLAAWKVERAYQPRIELAQLPEILAGRLAEVGKELWDAAQALATSSLNEERRKLEAERRVADELMDEALDLADATDARNRELAAEMERAQAENARLGAENARLAEEVKAAQARLGKVRADEFWDRVMREIYEVLPVDGSLKVAEIEPLLGRDLVGEAKGHVEPWTHETLRKKMDQRVLWKKYFAKAQGGRYSRRRA